MPGVNAVRFYDLFWRGLEPHRTEKYYPFLRGKLLEFMRRKMRSTDPVSGRDNRFGNTNKYLDGIWHFAIQRSPDIVIFYTMDGGVLNLAMVGSHHDYPFNGKNLTAAPRTANRVRNAVASDPADSPRWASLRWSDPRELLTHPDLPELSAETLDAISWELCEEMRTGERYLQAKGVRVEDTTQAEFERYFEDLGKASDLIMDIRAKGPNCHYWLENAPADFAFGTDLKL